MKTPDIAIWHFVYMLLDSACLLVLKKIAAHGIEILSATIIHMQRYDHLMLISS